MKSLNRKFVMFIFSFFMGLGLLWAQPGSGDPGGGGDPDVPITGIEWLLLAGGALGAKKIHDYRKGKE